MLDRMSYAISSEHATVGFFWLNAAEGWIDVQNDKLNTKVRKSLKRKRDLMREGLFLSNGVCFLSCRVTG